MDAENLIYQVLPGTQPIPKGIPLHLINCLPIHVTERGCLFQRWPTMASADINNELSSSLRSNNAELRSSTSSFPRNDDEENWALRTQQIPLQQPAMPLPKYIHPPPAPGFQAPTDIRIFPAAIASPPILPAR